MRHFEIRKSNLSYLSIRDYLFAITTFSQRIVLRKNAGTKASLRAGNIFGAQLTPDLAQ